MRLRVAVDIAVVDGRAALPNSIPLYRTFDYETSERYEVPLVNGLR